MQTIRLHDDYLKLYRGGLIEGKEDASFYERGLGYDQYKRKRVVPREEMCYLHIPVDDDMTIANGCSLYECVSDWKNRMATTKRFLGIPDDIKEANVHLNLSCCFTMDGRVVLFKTGAKPVRKEKTVTRYLTELETWGHIGKQWGVKNPKYHLKYWKFNEGDEYIICTPEDDLLFTLLPYLYETKIRPMRQTIRHESICAGGFETDDPNILAQRHEHWKKCNDTQLEMAEMLWNIEPFSLDEPYDYTDEQKKYISDTIEEIREKERAAQEELERRKNTPGYCSCCGREHADYVADPYYEEMYNERHMVWLCPKCYRNAAMDI